MKIRKDFFYYFAVLVYIFCMLFAIVCVFNRIGEGQEYPYLIKGTWLIGSFTFLLLLMAVWALWARLGITEKMNRHPKLFLALELMIVAVIVIIGSYLRYRVIEELPMAPASDYKTYYEMAVMIHDGTLLEEGVGYCDYVAMFPHVYGYPAVLATFFRIFGVSVYVAEFFNLIISIGSLFLVWGIARLLRGRFAALVALVMWSFLPSVILYSDFVASEPLFTFALLVAVLFFVMSMRKNQKKEKHPWICTIELVLMGVVLAFCAFIRPMAMIFLVAAMICMLPMERKKYDIPTNDVPLGVRAVDAGWKRCLIVLIVYFGCSKLFTMATSYAVDRELAGSSASFGYNLLVGLNLESYGGWNQEDADYLYDAFEATGSAQEAQMVCRDMAFERLKADLHALINLFVHKFDVLWGNDDYGASWNILFMDQQDNLTPERESFLYRMMDISDLVYLLMLLEAGIFGFVMFRLRPDALYSCVLLVLGTAALHLFVENQNRYHYHTLPFLAILAGAAGAAMSERVGVAVMARIEEKKKEKAAEEERIAHVRKLQEEEDERVRLRSEALHAQFDMAKAIEEGHIRIVASKAIEGAYAPKPVAQPSDDKKNEHEISEKSGSTELQEAEVLTVSELEKRAASEGAPADDKVTESVESFADDKVTESVESFADDKVTESEESFADDKVTEPEESFADDKVTEPEESPAEDKVPESEELPAEDKVPESDDLLAEDKVPESEESSVDDKVPESEGSPADEKVPESEESPADDKVPDGSSEDSSEKPNNECEG